MSAKQNSRLKIPKGTMWSHNKATGRNILSFGDMKLTYMISRADGQITDELLEHL